MPFVPCIRPIPYPMKSSGPPLLQETKEYSRGVLNLVDLAGSERVKKSGAQGAVFTEAVVSEGMRERVSKRASE